MSALEHSSIIKQRFSRTGYTGKELPCKTLDLTARERDEGIRLEEIENALP